MGTSPSVNTPLKVKARVGEGPKGWKELKRKEMSPRAITPGQMSHVCPVRAPAERKGVLQRVALQADAEAEAVDLHVAAAGERGPGRQGAGDAVAVAEVPGQGVGAPG